MEEYGDTERLLRLMFMQADFIESLLAERRIFGPQTEKNKRERYFYFKHIIHEAGTQKKAAESLRMSPRIFHYHWSALREWAEANLSKEDL